MRQNYILGKDFQAFPTFLDSNFFLMSTVLPSVPKKVEFIVGQTKLQKSGRLSTGIGNQGRGKIAPTHNLGRGGEKWLGLKSGFIWNF